MDTATHDESHPSSNIELPDQSNELLIEIGIIVAGPMDDVDRQAVTLAIEQSREYLTEALAGFRFAFFISHRPELAGEGRSQPSVLLQQAAEDRDARHWDFAFVLTASELVGHYTPFCFAALSRPLDAAVISLSLIDPRATSETAEAEDRVNQIASRSSKLMLLAIGHLTGLTSSDDDPTNILFHPATASEIDSMGKFDFEQLQSIRIAFAEIADLRLEEVAGRQANRILFFFQAAWINRREIAEAIMGAKPWQFPRRLSRLTIASVSTVAVLMMTAEAWDLALSQPAKRVVLLAVVSLVLTTVYVIIRQQLLVRRRRRYTEQTVVTATSTLLIVMIGMFVTGAVGLVTSHFI